MNKKWDHSMLEVVRVDIEWGETIIDLNFALIKFLKVCLTHKMMAYFLWFSFAKWKRLK